MDIAVLCGVLAGIVQIFGYWIYYTRLQKPNVGSWAIWAFGSSVDLAAYAFMTKDWVKNVLPVICALVCITIFIAMWTKRKFNRPDRLDIGFFGADCAITVVWSFTSATVASLLYQVSTIFSFIPMVNGMIKGKGREDSLPWIVWSIAYTLLLVAVIMRLEKWQELGYPISHLATHLTVAVLTVRTVRSKI